MMAFSLRRKRRLILLGALLILLALLAGLMYDSCTRLETTEYEITVSSLPDAFDGFRIVQLSDLHAAVFGKGNVDLLSAVRAAQPDIIAITGDMIDGGSELSYVEFITTALVEIAPVYYVTGNHEWGSGIARDVFAIIEECGATVLRNRYVLLEKDGTSITLAGIDDPNGLRDQKSPETLMDEIRTNGHGECVILLAHRNVKEYYNNLGADLVLCGHAHGGIIRLPFTDGLIDTDRTLFPKDASGTRTLEGGGTMLISRGLANTFPSLRLFNNPEIVVAILKKA